ncbi:MAG TPA: hypothetical protein VIH06_08080 [Ilumatobacteraceae bacterium]
MTLRSKPRLAAPAVVMALAACSSQSNDSVAQSAAAARTTTSVIAASTTTATTATGRPAVQEVIDVGGGQVLGIAASADSVWAISFDAGKLVRIDPSTNQVTKSVPIPRAASVLSNDGDLWVARYGSGSTGGGVDRLDATSAAQLASITGGDVCCDLTFGDNLLWLLDVGGTVRSVDPSTNTIGPEFPVSVDPNAHSNVVYGGGYLWASSDTTALHRIDRQTGETVDFDVGGGVPFVERDGLVWGASPTGVWAVDAATGAVEHRIDLLRSIEVISLEVGTSTIWVGVRRPGFAGEVRHVDISTGEVLDKFVDVDIPARIVLAFDSVWVTDSSSSNVFRIGPFTET